jgi:2-hydroxy-3-oxopropionate reductase
MSSEHEAGQRRSQGGDGSGASVGVFGVGNMGLPMTLNLLASGAQVHVYGRTPARLGQVIAAGAVSCSTPRELAESSTIILSMLPDLPQLRDILDGEDGIIAGIREPRILVVGSTSSATGVRELAADVSVATNGLLRVVDAPVSGGTDGATAANLSIMVGGAAEDFGAIEPTLAAMGKPVLLGPLGSGQIAKACNQMVVAATMLALSEAAVIAERSDLDVAALLEVFAGGYAGSNLLEARKQRLIEKDYSVSGVARFMVKDLSFARAAAENTGTTTPQLTLLQDVYSDLVDKGFGELDLSVTHAYIATLTEASGEHAAL